MNKENLKKGELGELDSLNEKLYDDFYLEKLEKRLETDPLLHSGLFGMLSDDMAPVEPLDCFCNPICDLGGCAIY